MHEKYSRQQLSSWLLSAGLCGELYVHSPNVISLQSPPLEKKKKSGTSVAGSCQLYLPPRPFWSPPVWDFTEWRRVMHKHGRTQRDALTHTNSRQESQKKNCERDKKQTGARNSRNTNPTGTHIHPSIHPSPENISSRSVNNIWLSCCEIYGLW